MFSSPKEELVEKAKIYSKLSEEQKTQLRHCYMEMNKIEMKMDKLVDKKMKLEKLIDDIWSE